MYDPKSSKAEEFISHAEVLETLKFAEENKNNAHLIDEIIEKAKLRKGLNTGRLRYCLPVNFPIKMKRFLRLPG